MENKYSLKVPNHTEQQVLQIINDVARNLAPNFTFGYYEVGDIEQEACMLAMDALPKYDSNKGAALKTFLYNHVRNRLITLKRDRYARPVPKDLDEDKVESWLRKNSSKRNLVDTIGIDDAFTAEESDATDFVEDIQKKEVLKIIDANLPVEYRGDYRCLMEGVKIPKHRKAKVLAILRKIIHEQYSTEEEGETE